MGVNGVDGVSGCERQGGNVDVNLIVLQASTISTLRNLWLPDQDHHQCQSPLVPQRIPHPSFISFIPSYNLFIIEALN